MTMPKYVGRFGSLACDQRFTRSTFEMFKRLIAIAASKVGLTVADGTLHRYPLNCVTGGVWIRQPNGSRHTIQNVIEQELCRKGMLLQDVNAIVAQRIHKEGTWSHDIAAAPIQVAIIGQVIVEKGVFDRPVKPIQHIDPATGRHFSDDSAGSGWRYMSGSFFRIEPDEVFRHRCENNHSVQRVSGTKITLDVRFYGPGGEIRGGHTKSVIVAGDAEEITELEAAANEVVDKLQQIPLSTLMRD
jgi:hypothetical protein